MAKMDNDKMWESILKELWHYPLNSWLVECIKAALKDQGLQYNSDTKKIESIEPKFTHISKSDWFICIKEINDFEVGKVYCIGKDSIIAVKEYFRPATPEEIPQDPKQDPCIDCKMASGGCALCCSKFKEYHSQSGEEVLSEFEDRLGEIMIPTWDITKECEECKREVYDIKKFAKELMDLARKQIASEINVDGIVQKFKDGVEETPHGILACLTLHGAYKLGMDDTLKAIKGE